MTRLPLKPCLDRKTISGPALAVLLLAGGAPVALQGQSPQHWPQFRGRNYHETRNFYGVIPDYCRVTRYLAQQLPLDRIRLEYLHP